MWCALLLNKTGDTMDKHEWLNKNIKELMSEYFDNYYYEAGVNFNRWCNDKWNELPKTICILGTQ